MPQGEQNERAERTGVFHTVCCHALGGTLGSERKNPTGQQSEWYQVPPGKRQKVPSKEVGADDYTELSAGEVTLLSNQMMKFPHFMRYDPNFQKSMGDYLTDETGGAGTSTKVGFCKRAFFDTLIDIALMCKDFEKQKKEQRTPGHLQILLDKCYDKIKNGFEQGSCDEEFRKKLWESLLHLRVTHGLGKFISPLSYINETPAAFTQEETLHTMMQYYMDHRGTVQHRLKGENHQIRRINTKDATQPSSDAHGHELPDHPALPKNDVALGTSFELLHGNPKKSKETLMRMQSLGKLLRTQASRNSTQDAWQQAVQETFQPVPDHQGR